MNFDKLKAVTAQIAARVPVVRGKGEEATKQALVLPLLDALGYDIWNPVEVCPEYEADFAVKKAGQKEKVDLAVLVNGAPRIYFEVKAVEVPLDGHEGQLARYFNSTATVSLAVLTNGIEYRFYTDTGDANIMDGTPFHVTRFDAPDPNLDVLARFHRSVFSPEAIREFATQLNYTAKISSFLRGQLDLRERDPSERLVRWVLAEEGSYSGRVTTSVVERFQPIVRDALQIVLRDIVRRSVAALDNEVSAAPAPAATPAGLAAPASGVASQSIPEAEDVTAPSAAGSPDDRRQVVTTETELTFFSLIRTIYDASEFAGATIRDNSLRRDVPIELAYKDTTSYFGVYFNKPAYWCMRAVLGGKTQWVGFNLDPEQCSHLVPTGFTVLPPSAFSAFRVAISGPDDVNALSRLVLAAFAKTLQDRNGEGAGPEVE